MLERPVEGGEALACGNCEGLEYSRAGCGVQGPVSEMARIAITPRLIRNDSLAEHRGADWMRAAVRLMYEQCGMVTLMVGIHAVGESSVMWTT